MPGGPSHVDLLDPKPRLAEDNGKPLPFEKPRLERTKTGNLLASPWKFHKHGGCGIEVSELFPEVGSCIDDICVVRSMHTNVPNHEPGLLLMTCGHNQATRPSMGSWLTYGLGTENQNLPGFVVMCPGKPVVGPALWNNSFLPGPRSAGRASRNRATSTPFGTISNRPPIRRAWFFVVFPALILNYLGQGALVLADLPAAAILRGVEQVLHQRHPRDAAGDVIHPT